MDDVSDSSDLPVSPTSDPVDDLYSAQEDEPASEEGEEASEIVCPCVSSESFSSAKVVDKKS